MSRQPSCFRTGESEWVCNITKRSGNAIGVTIPAAIVRYMGLRPGCTVHLQIRRIKVPLAPEEDDREAGEDGSR